MLIGPTQGTLAHVSIRFHTHSRTSSSLEIDIKLDFGFKCGLTRKLPSKKEGLQPDWGVDVYGNGRLIEKFLKTEIRIWYVGARDRNQGARSCSEVS